MALILDTSAVIGWVERQSPSLLAHLRDHVADVRPAVHVVTLGELERGVAEARNAPDRQQRVDTLTFARTELERLDIDSAPDGQTHVFGLLGGVLSRKVSHNDCWIAAGAITADHTLVTQDEDLAAHLRRARAASVHGHATFGDWLEVRGKALDVALCPD